MIGPEESGNLPHLRNPAIGLRNHIRQRHFESCQDRRLAERELVAQRIGRARLRCRDHHGRADPGEALDDAGIRHLQRRRRADRACDDPHVEAEVLQHRDLLGVLAGHVEGRALAAGLRRKSDDAGVDERRLRRADDLLDPLHRIDIDRVAIDDNRLLCAPDDQRRQAFGQRDSFARRHDREDDVGLSDRLVLGADHAGVHGPLQGRLAPSLQRRQHARSVLAETAGHGAAHGTGGEDRNGL